MVGEEGVVRRERRDAFVFVLCSRLFELLTVSLFTFFLSFALLPHLTRSSPSFSAPFDPSSSTTLLLSSALPFPRPLCIRRTDFQSHSLT